MATYKDFLLWLVALGPKLPQALVILQEIVEKLQDVVALFRGPQPLNAAPSPTPEEIGLEGQVVSAASGGGHAANAGILRDLFAFIREHPELIALIMSLFKS